MLLVREIMYCKPGKVKAFVEKTLAMQKLMKKLPNQPSMRVMTDFCGEQFWMCVMQMEVPDMATFEKLMSGEGESQESMKEFENIMKGYHDLVDHGRREIYKIEG
ncbi:MAG TPA: hypothetical protein VFR25_01820 [Candidatus Eisenbacteria bacterium]|nr:hypothetical protein [Candidatus Eisenbacteria bacterium]